MITQTLSPHEKPPVKTRKPLWIALVAGVLVVGLAAAYVLIRPETTVVREEANQTAAASPTELEEVSELRTFFGHQSVGQNIVDAIPGIYAATGLSAPNLIESSTALAGSGGYIQHAYLGTNGDPLGKIAEFDRIMRSGVADQVDVAAMKLCYIDFDGSTDVDRVFTAYRDTLAGLERDYPNVTFVYMTAPLTADRGMVKRVKVRLGIDDSYSPADNVVREAFNEKIRAQYSQTGQMFDIAGAQSTVDGSRALRSFDSANYYAMEDSLASDLGHLNQHGSAVVGSAFLAAVAQASRAHAG